MGDDLYNIKNYSEQQLYDILDMNNPTDRELEAKILHLIHKYSNMQNETGNKMADFFQQIYDYFFNEDEDTEDDRIEGFEGKIKIDEQSQTIGNAVVGYTPQQISSVQQFDYAPDKLQLNPLLKQTIKRIISIDSQYRDINTSPMPTDFTFDLSEPLRDVVSLKLYSIQIPYTWYTISKSYGSNFMYLKGSNDGIANLPQYNYKIAIKPGNYGPADLVNAINASFSDLSNNTASDINFNGLNLLSYDSTTSKTTVNLNLQNTYNESYYSFSFPPDISFANYLGFVNQTYYPYRVNSNETYRTTITINSQTSQDYYLDNSNNYFTIIQYLGYDEFTLYDARSKILNTIKIQLQNNGLNFVGNATRADIISSVNAAIQSSGYFDSTSGISQIDITNGNTYYQLQMILNRYKTKYIPNSKIAVIFPSESQRTNQYDEKYTIWQIQNGINTSCFYFDNLINEFSEFISERPPVQSSYKIDSSANILLKCVSPNYNNSLNDINMNIPSTGVNNSYTLIQYLNTITGVFSAKNTELNQNIFNMTNTVAKIDSFNRFNLQLDLTKTFINKNYSISFDQTSVLCQATQNGYGPGFTPVAVDLSSQNIFGGTIQKIYTGYAVDVSYIFTIKPYIGYTNDGNGNAPPLNVCLPDTITYPYYYSTYNAFILAIQNAITSATINISNINDSQTPLSKSFISYTEYSDHIDLSMNINYSYYLSEANYEIYFVDGVKPMENIDNAWHKLNIDVSYNLYEQAKIPNTNPQSYYPYGVIVGNTPITGDQTITLTENSNKIIITTNNSTSPADTITLALPINIPYTIFELYTAINTAFSQNPKTYGSTISSYLMNNQEYTLFRLNVNRIFTTADYNLVFYDPISFVACYAGSRSVQNTTWDSTIGWILGFRDYTQYSLVKSNQVQNTTFTDQYYYLSSVTGSFTINQTISTNGKLLTNTTIALTGDTTLSTNLYNYFLISLDDFIQNHLNDGLVTITRSQTSIPIPGYAYSTTQVCDPATGTLVSRSSQQSNSDNVTNSQLYSMNQSIVSQQNTVKSYSAGPFVKDIFGLIPIKVPAKNGDYYIEFGGSLQNQERTYFGPVNIRKMSIQLMNDRGDIVDLNGSNWSFSFICEQLYKATST